MEEGSYVMKIKAAVVDKVNDPFVIKDDVELADLETTVYKLKLLHLVFVILMKHCVKVMPPLVFQLF